VEFFSRNAWISASNSVSRACARGSVPVASRPRVSESRASPSPVHPRQIPHPKRPGGRPARRSAGASRVKAPSGILRDVRARRSRSAEDGGDEVNARGRVLRLRVAWNRGRENGFFLFFVFPFSRHLESGHDEELNSNYERTRRRRRRTTNVCRPMSSRRLRFTREGERLASPVPASPQGPALFALASGCPGWAAMARARGGDRSRSSS
jgi:hypothetical protein